mgnify:CR=1 FL=1
MKQAFASPAGSPKPNLKMTAVYLATSFVKDRSFWGMDYPFTATDFYAVLQVGNQIVAEPVARNLNTATVNWRTIKMVPTRMPNVGINYKLTDHALLYLDAAQGFRDGGSNSGFPPGCYDRGAPAKYVPDTLTNYEFGWKTTSLAGRLVLNGAAYQMDWKDLQTTIYDPDICAPSSFNANVGNARVRGAEANIDFKADGRTEPKLPGDACVRVGELPLLAVGQTFRITRHSTD